MKGLEAVRQAVLAAQEHMLVDFCPRLGLTLGTGLSDLANEIDVVYSLPFGSIPGLPVSTVESHRGELILGRLGGQNIAALAGCFHFYESSSPAEVYGRCGCWPSWGWRA
ncbi:hypothetical protein DFAR_3360014 [Desulfarculales bacterium]